jgi:nitrogen regulatory protein PII
MIVVALTFIAPKHIIPIAYDSGGVTTSTVTVPLMAALGIGLATNIDGRSPLIDGFGLIAFASLFPMITVMLYGIIAEKLNIKSDSQIASEEELLGTDDMLVKAPNILDTLNLSALIVIVPKDRQDEALHVAKDAGAYSATILNASGVKLSELEHIYRYTAQEKDSLLLFIVSSTVVDSILQGIIKKLHIKTTGDGIAFSMPISKIEGLSLKQQNNIQI